LHISVKPNPSWCNAVLSVFSKAEMEVNISVSGLDGKQFSVNAHLIEGENRLSLTAFESLPAGFYFVSISAEGFQFVMKWVKL